MLRKPSFFPRARNADGDPACRRKSAAELLFPGGAKGIRTPRSRCRKPLVASVYGSDPLRETTPTHARLRGRLPSVVDRVNSKTPRQVRRTQGLLRKGWRSTCYHRSGVAVDSCRDHRSRQEFAEGEEPQQVTCARHKPAVGRCCGRGRRDGGRRSVVRGEGQ